jgi:hypothetical protein
MVWASLLNENAHDFFLGFFKFILCFVFNFVSIVFQSIVTKTLVIMTVNLL